MRSSVAAFKWGLLSRSLPLNQNDQLDDLFKTRDTDKRQFSVAAFKRSVVELVPVTPTDHLDVFPKSEVLAHRLSSSLEPPDQSTSLKKSDKYSLIGCYPLLYFSSETNSINQFDVLPKNLRLWHIDDHLL